MSMKYFIWILLILSLAGCGEINLDPLATLLAPPAETLAAKGGQVAGTQSAKILQTAQAGFATESGNLKETAKSQAATYAASLIDTAQANLVTQAANQVTAAPTQVAGLKKTAEALIDTEIAGNLPLVQTQAAMLLQGTREFILGTALADNPLAAETQAEFLAQTMQAAAVLGTPIPSLLPVSTEIPAAPLQGFPDLPSPTPVPPASGIIITYLVQEGQPLTQVARWLGVPFDQIIRLNPRRQSWPPLPGAAIVIARQPENLPFPSGQQPWSSTPGCNVAQIDWLEPPIHCVPVTLDVVDRLSSSLECVSLDNPLGQSRHHTVYLGWMLKGAGNVTSYGWFVDRGKNSVVIGPAVVYAQAQSTECGRIK